MHISVSVGAEYKVSAAPRTKLYTKLFNCLVHLFVYRLSLPKPSTGCTQFVFISRMFFVLPLFFLCCTSFHAFDVILLYIIINK